MVFIKWFYNNGFYKSENIISIYGSATAFTLHNSAIQKRFCALYLCKKLCIK